MSADPFILIFFKIVDCKKLWITSFHYQVKKYIFEALITWKNMSF